MKSTKSKIIVGMGVGCGFLCLLGVIALAAFAIRNDQQLKNVSIQVDAPSAVALDEEFIIEIRVENSSDKIYTLKDIDVQAELLEGVFIASSEPPFYDTFLGAATGYQNYKFDESIPAKGNLVVQLHAVGNETGKFTGDFDICINDVGSCLGVPVRIVVGN